MNNENKEIIESNQKLINIAILLHILMFIECCFIMEILGQTPSYNGVWACLSEIFFITSFYFLNRLTIMVRNKSVKNPVSSIILFLLCALLIFTTYWLIFPE